MIPSGSSIDLAHLKKRDRFFPQIQIWEVDEAIQIYFQSDRTPLRIKKGNNEQH